MKDTLSNEFSNELIRSDLVRLVNQIWKLLPMREKNEDWKKQLSSVIIELRGLHLLFGGQLDFLILITKLLGLQEEEDFMAYRIAIFSAISSLNTISQTIPND